MARLIDADDYCKANGCSPPYGNDGECVNCCICDCPTVEQQKTESVVQGNWIHCWGKTALWYCSNCGEKIMYNPERRTRNVAKSAVHELNRFCRACGAKMVGFHSVDYSHLEKPTKDIGRR